MATKSNKAPSNTPRFEGRDVIGTKIAIANAGDGLSQALAIDPVTLHIGDTVFVLMECVVSEIKMVPVKDTETLTRNHRLSAGTATLVDDSFAGDAIRAQAAKIEAARQASGLTFGDEPEDGDGGE